MNCPHSEISTASIDIQSEPSPSSLPAADVPDGLSDQLAAVIKPESLAADALERALAHPQRAKLFS
jgi:hypothetical protein